METVGEPVLTPLDFDLAPDGSYDRFDPSNLDFRIWLGWSREGRIHVAAQFADDVYFNEYGFGPSDLLTLIVDGDHTGGLYLPFSLSRPPEEAEDPLENNMQAQAYQAVSRAAGDPMVDMVTTTLFVDERWMVEPPFARGGGGVFGENPAYWSVEFYVTCFDRLNHLSPEDSDVSQLAEGKIIGFDIWVFDVDDDSGLVHNWISKRYNVYWGYATKSYPHFVDGRGSGHPGALGAVGYQRTAVRSACAHHPGGRLRSTDRCDRAAAEDAHGHCEQVANALCPPGPGRPAGCAAARSAQTV